MSHTPGPWRFDATDMQIANVTRNICRVSEYVFDWGDNGRLIAAAPDMLAALKAYIVARPQCDCSEHSGCDVATARANACRAVAKAEGYP